MLRQEGQQFWRQRLEVAWVHVKIFGRDNDVLWIGCLHDEQSARLKHTESIKYQYAKSIKSNVLNQVKRCHGNHTFRRQGLQEAERIAFFYFQPL